MPARTQWARCASLGVGPPRGLGPWRRGYRRHGPEHGLAGHGVPGVIGRCPSVRRVGRRCRAERSADACARGDPMATVAPRPATTGSRIAGDGCRNRSRRQSGAGHRGARGDTPPAERPTGTDPRTLCPQRVLSGDERQAADLHIGGKEPPASCPETARGGTENDGSQHARATHSSRRQIAGLGGWLSRDRRHPA